MKKLLPILLLLMLCTAAAVAEAPEATPALTPTPVPEMIAQPDATPRPVMTATPRPTDAPLPADPFLGNAVEISRRIGQLAESEVYFNYSDTSYSTTEVWESVSRGDHTTPSRIFSLSGENLVASLVAASGASEPWFDMSRPEIRRDLVDELVDSLLSRQPSEWQSAISELSRQKVFACEGYESSGLMILLYEGGVPVILTWYGEQGAVRMAASFLPDESLEACATAEDISQWFVGQGMPDVAFEEVHW